MTTYSVSQIFSDQCHKAWGYRYLEGLRPVRVTPEMSVGSYGHSGIEAYWNGADPHSAIEDAHNETCDKIDTLTCPMEQKDELCEEAHRNRDTADGVFEAWRVTFKPEEWEPLRVESRLELPLSGGDVFVAVVDFVGRLIKTGDVYCLDWKFRKTFVDGLRNEFPLQQIVYSHILDREGISVDRHGIVQIKNEAPKTPKTNKNTTISRADCATTWTVYKDAVIAAGHDPSDYSEMEEKLALKRWVEMDTNDWSAHERASVWDQIVRPRIEELQDRHEQAKMETLNLTRTGFGTFQCGRCLYKEVCTADLFGYDLDRSDVYEIKLPS